MSGTYNKTIKPQWLNTKLYNPEDVGEPAEMKIEAKGFREYENSDGTEGENELGSKLSVAQIEHIRDNISVSLNDGTSTSDYVSPDFLNLYVAMVALKLQDSEVDLAVTVIADPATTLVDIFGTKLY